MFGKNLSEYIRFDLWILILIALVFVARFAVSQSGTPFSTTRWISINIVLLLGLVYCSIAVHTSEFGAYKQLLGLLLVQTVFAHLLIGFGIAFGIVSGTSNIYTIPEVSGGSNGATWFHALIHPIIAGPLLAVLGWLFGSVILFATKRLAKSAAAATI